MRRTEFIETMKDYANKYGEPTITEVKKPNNNYTGLTLKKNGVPVPVANLDMAYIRYCEGEWDMDRCYEYIDYAFEQKMDEPFDISQITDWEKAKNRLYIKLAGSLSEGVFRKKEDIYLIPYLQVSDDGSATVRVTKELIEMWDVDEDTVFDIATSNQETLRPVKIASLAETVGIGASDLPVYIVSTKTGVCGASAIFYNGVFDNIREKIGEDYFIIPSSIHEVLVLPKSLNDDINELVDMVTMINNADVREEERLTNSIYTFDFEKEEFRKVG